MTSLKGGSREALFSSSPCIFHFRRRGSASGSDLGGSTPVGEPRLLDDSLYPTLRPACTSSKPIVPASGVEVILRRCPVCARDSIIGHGRRRKQAHDEHHDWIGIRRGLCHGCGKTFIIFPLLSLPQTHYSLLARFSGAPPTGGWSSAPGKRLLKCPILPCSAAGRAAWIAPNRLLPFCAELSPAWPAGWGATLRRIPKLGRCRCWLRFCMSSGPCVSNIFFSPPSLPGNAVRFLLGSSPEAKTAPWARISKTQTARAVARLFTTAELERQAGGSRRRVRGTLSVTLGEPAVVLC